MTAAISIRDLEHRFDRGEFTLTVRSLDVAAGEAIALIGPSGSGKSTLLQLIAGILLPTAGRVLLDGVAWDDLGEGARRARRIRRVGLVFQEFELLDHLTVRENVLLPYFVNAALAKDESVEERVARLLERAGIASHAHRKPRELSQGERQRVALCRALSTSPGVILADEPTGNLDPLNARRAIDLLLAEARAHSATLVLVTHDHALLADFPRVTDLADVARTTGTVAPTAPRDGSSESRDSTGARS